MNATGKLFIYIFDGIGREAIDIFVQDRQGTAWNTSCETGLNEEEVERGESRGGGIKAKDRGTDERDQRGLCAHCQLSPLT